MKKIIMRILAVIAVGALFIAYGRYVRHSTIVSAELVEDNGETYIISFGGEDHIYEK